jgi:alpha-2-macroglobulin
MQRWLFTGFLLLLIAPAGAQKRPVRLEERAAIADEGRVFRLSEGTPEREAVAKIARPPAETLDDSALKKVLDRLPALPEIEGESLPFALREGSLPPPRTGRTVAAPFPPPPGGPGVERPPSGPLEVRRRAPVGDVPLAPHLSVTFSQSMVALTSHEVLRGQAVPVHVSPEPPGRWRWVGTQTLLFEPDGRFPMATDYGAEVPAGTRSATGGALAQAVSWTFGTPAPTLVGKHPVDVPVRREALVFAAFDQRIDPAAVLATVRVVAAGGSRPVRRATDAEIAQDEVVTRLVEGAPEGRWLAFRPESPLPADAPVTVTIGPGTPSAEGPKKTTAAQSWGYRTFGPLRVVSHRCGWSPECPPQAPWQITLTNPVDAKAFRKDMVHVEPALPGRKADAFGNVLSVHGSSRGRTTYRVTLSSEIRDVFGQTLEPAAPLEFAVGSAPESLTAPGGNFVVLDPAAGPHFSVFSTNHDVLRVRAWSVRPEDWQAWLAYLRASLQNQPAAPPGRAALDKTVQVQAAPDERVETRIDLASALPGGRGHVVLVVEPTRPPKGRATSSPIRVWVQATSIGLDAFVDDETLLAWATSLRDGRPLAGAALQIVPSGPSATTGADGLATLPLPPRSGGLLVARVGDDVAFLPEQAHWWGGESGWRRQERKDELRFYVFDDRHMYRPGETVRVKGWARRVGAGPQGDLAPAEVRAGDYLLNDSQGNEVAKGEVAFDPLGGFELSLSLPGTMNLGTASLQIAAGGTQHHHAFEVQEFRRPEYEVTASASEGPHIVGGHAAVTASAAYYAGGALPGAPVSWRVTATAGHFTPPNRGDWTFGEWIPWWEAPEGKPPEWTEELTGETDATGRHRLRIDFERGRSPRPRQIEAQASVTDVNRQAWTASASLLLHPATLYVGLRSERLFVERGQPLRIDAIVTDLDGRAVSGRSVSVVAERLEWEQEAGEWKEKAVDPQTCPLVSASDGARCTFKTPEGGRYRVTARVTDDDQRPNETKLRLWVAGGRTTPRRSLEQEAATLVPDKKEYRPGEVARLLVLAPFAPAEGLLTLRRSGLLRQERFTMTGPSHTLEVRVEDALVPDVHVQVDLVGAAPRTNDSGEVDPNQPPRPAFASGTIDLAVPPYSRTLALSVTPREAALPPGGETILDISLRGASGAAVRGEVAVVVVDEAVLALTGYGVPDPLAAFYARREAGVRDHHLRASVVLGRSPTEGTELGDLLGQAAGVNVLRRDLPAAAPAVAFEGAMSMKIAETVAATPIRTRTDFAALALFAGRLPTDGDGHASVKVKLPDSLTRYRVMAVAAAGAKQFGKGETTLTARLPIMVRPSPPRFLNFGDRLELPIVVQNQTDAPLSVDVGVRARNLDLLEGGGRRISVPAQDRVEVRFPAAAARAGRARFQVGAVAGSLADAAVVDFPVWTPATTEAFATYGQIDQGAVVQPVEAPPNVLPGLGGLTVTTSSTALQALTDAVLYLVAYPFECAEQLSSRVLAVAALKDVLTAFRAEGLPKPDEMVAAVKRDVERLRGMQNDDGGFAFWRRGEVSWPYVSIHVAHALARAREKGFEVPGDTLDRSRKYLKEVESRIPADYPEDVRRTLVAYALHVRQRLGDPDPARARALVREAGPEKLSFEAIGWLLGVLHKDPGSRAEGDRLKTFLMNRVTETAGAAHFAVSYRDGGHLILASDRRADAVVLEALVAAEPASDLVPKIVAGLLAHRKAGRWGNTQENTFVLLALDRYFNAYEKATPDFVARTWLGESYAGEHAFRGRSTDRHEIVVPMERLARTEGPDDLVLAKEGTGRLYYRLGLRYAPASLRLDPADHGFTVERRYEGADDPADVRRDPDGVWHVRAGSRVRVRLTLVAPARRYHVALVDPLPAGLEALNPALAVTGALPGDRPQEVAIAGAPGLGGPRGLGHWWWWSRPWFEHQNLRDERVEAFSSLLWEGVWRYDYVARATTPGAFVVPPAKAEEMYSPETFGRGGTDRLVVE